MRKAPGHGTDQSANTQRSHTVAGHAVAEPQPAAGDQQRDLADTTPDPDPGRVGADASLTDRRT